MELFSSLTLITYYFDAGGDKEQVLITAVTSVSLSFSLFAAPSQDLPEKTCVS